MNKLREIQIKHIISQARLMQQMYSNHECTADEIVGRTHNEQIIILASRIEELEAQVEELQTKLSNVSGNFVLMTADAAEASQQAHKLKVQVDQVKEWFATPSPELDALYEILHPKAQEGE